MLFSLKLNRKPEPQQRLWKNRKSSQRIENRLKEQKTISKGKPKAHQGTSLLGLELVSGCWVCQAGFGLPVGLAIPSMCALECKHREAPQHQVFPALAMPLKKGPHGRLMYIHSHRMAGWKKESDGALFCSACSEKSLRPNAGAGFTL